MPLALQMSLHLSSDDTPEYFGTHTTEGAMRLLLKFWPLLSHCSSRKVLPAWRGEGGGGGGVEGESAAGRKTLLDSSPMRRLVPVSGQRFRLQERYLTRTPWQYFPPFEGTGLLHSLLDSCTPPPQVREQEPNWPHLPQRPSTWTNTGKI